LSTDELEEVLDHNHCWVCYKPVAREPGVLISFCSRECREKYDKAYANIERRRRRTRTVGVVSLVVVVLLLTIHMLGLIP